MDHDILAELESLRREVAELRTRLEPGHAVGGGVNRRQLLRAAPVAVLGGAMAMIAGAAPAGAAVGDPVLQGQQNSYSGTTTLTGGSSEEPAVVVIGSHFVDRLSVGSFTGGSADGPAVEITGSQLVDQLSVGAFPLVGSDILLSVAAHPNDAPDGLPSGPVMAVRGFSVIGQYITAGSTALQVDAIGPGVAMIVNIQDGTSETTAPEGGPTVYAPGTGLQVNATQSTAIDVQMGDANTSRDAVTIEYGGNGRAFYAVSSSQTNINGTVTGVNEGHGIGVWGEQRNDSVSGYGVVGVAGARGRGAQFQGGAAAVRLVPATGATHPNTGKVGDVYVDKGARIWFCTDPSTGATHATWRQLAFV